MKTRAELKELAKKNFKSNYWVCVGALVLTSLCLGIIAGIACLIDFGGNLATLMTMMRDSTSSVPFMSSFSSLVALFIGAPLTVGLASFFVKIVRNKEAQVISPFEDAFSGYGRKLGGMLWEKLFTFLWALLLVIPGIIKSYAYAMNRYILADCPEVSATEALKISQRMMRGHKGELFLLDLSFIGWYLLSSLTFGLLGIFYVNPYAATTRAEYYKNLLEVSIEKGIISKEELGKNE